MEILENQWVIALINTLIVPAVIMIIGWVVEVVSDIQVGVMIRYIGRGPALFIRNRLTFIGTIHHELAHALFATITGAKVTKIELLKFDGEALGCVQFNPRGNRVFRDIQMTMSAIAPIVCGCATLYGLYNVMQIWCVESWQVGITIFVMISILYHMNMSSQDMKGAIKGLPVCLIVLYIIFAISKVNMLVGIAQYLGVTI